MKKSTLFSLMLGCTMICQAQLSLTRAVRTPTGISYIEISNKAFAKQSVSCYSLISYYRNATERGFYVITLPAAELEGKSSMVVTSGQENAIGMPAGSTLTMADLFQKGRLLKMVFNDVDRSFVTAPKNRSFENASWGQGDEQLVLLLNGNTVVDASFSVDANGHLPAFLRSLPNLDFSTTCSTPVTIPLGSLEALYPDLFRRPSRATEYNTFRDFDVRMNSATVQIAWQTARDQNIRGFNIERRVGGEPWTTVAFVATVTPTGNKDQSVNYLYGDQNVRAGNVEYRLSQIDINGNTIYSSTKTLNNFGGGEKVVIYPNPSPDGRATVAFGNVNSLRDVLVFDLNGQLVQQWLSVNNSSQQVSNLRPGTFIFKVLDRQTGTIHSEKLIVAKQ